MRKFLAVLMAVFMLAATLAALPISAEEATATVSMKDGSTAADAEAIDLVITEVASNTKSTLAGSQSKFDGDAYSYIEIYNRGDDAVDLSDYAIVQADYSVYTEWDSKFTKLVPIVSGDVFASFEHSTTAGYRANCNAGLLNQETILEAGKTAIIWFWNASANAAANKNKDLSKHDTENGILFPAFRNYYKNQYKNADGVTVSAEIPADTLIVAVYGTDEVPTSFALNTSGNKMYGLVKNTGEGFDLSEAMYEQISEDVYEKNDDVICIWEHGTGLGATTAETKSAIYTTANNVPHYFNAYYEDSKADYVAINNAKCEGFKELGCIWYNEMPVTPGVLLPIQWADLDPDRAPASVKGEDANWTTTVWNTYVTALVAANRGTDVGDRAEEDKNQDKINVDRGNLGNLGQNALGAWIYFTKDEGGVTKYFRYQNDGQHTEADGVEITKEEYDIAIAALAEAEKGEGLGMMLWIIIGGGAAVVLGAGAVVLILILKKKNKNVAADDVAGDVQIIDEDGVTIAVEEAAPVAEEPVAEETTEE